MSDSSYSVLVNGELACYFCSLDAAEEWVSRWNCANPDDICLVLFPV